MEFIAIDFETANPKRVSACSLGYVIVHNSRIIEKKGYLIKPIGGHAPFQTKIHGITEELTCDKPEFGDLFPQIQDIFNYTLVAHSLFDKQVLAALSDYFHLGLSFNYIDSSSIAKEKFPNLENYKLTTIVRYLGLPPFKHHDAIEDAVACANIFLKLQENDKQKSLKFLKDELSEFKGLVIGILADDEVNYKEAYELLYWLEDHVKIAEQYENIYLKTKEVLEDDYLDKQEAIDMKNILCEVLKTF